MNFKLSMFTFKCSLAQYINIMTQFQHVVIPFLEIWSLYVDYIAEETTPTALRNVSVGRIYKLNSILNRSLSKGVSF